MLVFIYCVENFVNISMQIINTVSEYAGVLSRLFSTMADWACLLTSVNGLDAVGSFLKLSRGHVLWTGLAL